MDAPPRHPTLTAGIVLLVAGTVATVLWLARTAAPAPAGAYLRPRVPAALLLEDYQRPLDRELLEVVRKTEDTIVSRFLDSHVLKPFFDDVQTRRVAVDGVELTPAQFPERPDLFQLVDDCAKVLHLAKRPRVFIVDAPGLNASTFNLVSPVIVVHASVFRRYRHPAEIRFILGHEMGHIAAGHVRWLTLVRAVLAAVAHARVIPQELSAPLVLPVLKWAREAEMTADNAGLICCQDPGRAERALVRLALGLEEEQVGPINVEAYLDQAAAEDLSKFSEAAQYLRQLAREHPFLPDRIRQLRAYRLSRNYQHLWE